MMHRFVIALIFCWTSCHANIAQLHYLPNVSVQQTSKLSIEIQESLPVLNLTTKGNQILKFNIASIQNQHLFQLTLKDIFVDLSINNEHMTFDPRSVRAPIPLIQLSRLIDKPIRFRISSDGSIVDEQHAIEKLMKEFPSLKKIHFDAFLNDMTQYLFVLANKKLDIGSTFKERGHCPTAGFCPDVIIYKILDITDNRIFASLKGNINPTTIVLKTPINVDGETHEQVEMTVTGSMQGDIAWNRNHALFCDLNIEYAYNAQLKADDLHWTMNMNLIHKLTSHSP